MLISYYFFIKVVYIYILRYNIEGYIVLQDYNII
nr:MAG TPA: hypothetical protein [Caudoviricetes sp.]